MVVGVIGGRFGYRLLRLLSPGGTRSGCSGIDLSGDRSKLDIFFDQAFWNDVKGRIVIDFGCGYGTEAIEMVKRGAKEVVGIDIRSRVLDVASKFADAEGITDRTVFTESWEEKADTIVCIDAFEHFDDPGNVLDVMSTLLIPKGAVWAVFGPPWYHPYGGHLFSVFPWAHLIFSETALIRWRSDFKTDGARHFTEVEGGLNQMTISRFERIVASSPFRFERLDLIPIRRLRFFANSFTREYTTSSVRCRLVLK